MKLKNYKTATSSSRFLVDEKEKQRHLLIARNEFNRLKLDSIATRGCNVITMDHTSHKPTQQEEHENASKSCNNSTSDTITTNSIEGDDFHSYHNNDINSKHHNDKCNNLILSLLSKTKKK